MRWGKELLQKIIIIPHRHIVVIITFLGILNAYQMRMALNVAITVMVVTKDGGNHTDSGESCPVDEYFGNNTLPKIPPDDTKKFNWSEETQGLILSSFYWGYVLTHLPGGVLADKFGGKYCLGIGLLLTAVFTLLVPAAANGGENWLLTAKFLTGLGEGTTFPGTNNVLAKWIPLEERAFLGSFVYAGGLLGTVTGTLITGALLTAFPGNWPLVFYFFGGVGLLWALCFFLLCYSSPETHPFITEKERNFLREKIIHEKGKSTPPWRSICTSLPLFALICAQIGHDWAFYTMVSDLPKYMSDVLKFSISANGVLSALPYIVMWLVSIVFGWISDQMINRKCVSVTAARRIITTIAHIGPSIGVVGASYAGCDRVTVVTLFCFAMGTMGCFYPGMKVNAMDLSPNYAGTLMAIVNGIGGITGIIAPYLVGVLTPNHTIAEWRTVFLVTAGVNLVTIVIFDIFSSGDIQPWNSYGASTLVEPMNSSSVMSQGNDKGTDDNQSSSSST